MKQRTVAKNDAKRGPVLIEWSIKVPWSFHFRGNLKVMGEVTM